MNGFSEWQELAGRPVLVLDMVRIIEILDAEMGFAFLERHVIPAEEIPGHVLRKIQESVNFRNN